MRQGTEDFDRTSIYGVSEAFYRADTQKTMQGSSLENGRFLRYIDVERHQNVCVIGSYLAENASGRIRWVRRFPSAACPTW